MSSTGTTEQRRFDLVVRGGRVVDGTGLPAYVADVGVVDGRIAAIALLGDAAIEAAATVVDAHGMLVMPGFIDVHTHYDAQLHFEGTASPASWHGVTTVITGNCGFTIAPSKPEDVSWLLAMLSRVEGMPAAALDAGVQFRGGGVGALLDGLDGRIAVNAAVFVGHSAVRRFVMGDDAQTRAATDAEIAAMQELVRTAMQEGAIGFSSSQLEIHQAHNGLPVPSNLATADEVLALGSVLAEFDHGVIEFIAWTFLDGYDADDRALVRELALRSGKPVDLGPVFLSAASPEAWRDTIDFVDEAARDGLRLHPQYAVHRGGAFFTLDNTFLFDEVAPLLDALTQPEPKRSEVLGDPVARGAIKAALQAPGSFPLRAEITTVYAVHRPEHQSWVGKTLSELVEERGGHHVDVFLDVSLEDNLLTTWFVQPLSERGGNEVTAQFIRNPMLLPGASDGGAHLTSFVGADYTTRLLTDWVPDHFTLEEAVRKLTAVPAAIHGIHDRGTLRPGAWADIVVADPERLAVGETRWAADFPGASERLVADAEGYRAVIVNGEVILDDGAPTGARPGRTLRFT
jgi:N-acyl-D-aspartate/D-glutamate deacylase